jgi:hypothetical protein
MIVWMAREQGQLKSLGSEGMGNPMGNARSIADDDANWRGHEIKFMDNNLMLANPWRAARSDLQVVVDY